MIVLVTIHSPWPQRFGGETGSQPQGLVPRGSAPTTQARVRFPNGPRLITSRSSRESGSPTKRPDSFGTSKGSDVILDGSLAPTYLRRVHASNGTRRVLSPCLKEFWVSDPPAVYSVAKRFPSRRSHAHELRRLRRIQSSHPSASSSTNTCQSASPTSDAANAVKP
jgi:hypothetical protein